MICNLTTVVIIREKRVRQSRRRMLTKKTQKT